MYITGITVGYYVFVGLQTGGIFLQGGRTILLAFGRFQIEQLWHVVRAISHGSLVLHLTHGVVMNGHTVLGVSAKTAGFYCGISVLGCSIGQRRYAVIRKSFLPY